MRWTIRLAAAAATLALAGPAAAQAYDGEWEGALQAGAQKLRLELQVKTEGNETSAVLNSLDQGAVVPATAVKVENGEIGILFLNIGGELKGKLSADGKTLNATWAQGRELPLTLTRKAAK